MIAGRTRLDRAIEFSSFKVLQAQEHNKGFNERGPKSPQFFREGKADKWRTVLRPEQVRRTIVVHGEQMARFGYIPPATE